MADRLRGLLIVALLLAGFALKGSLIDPPPAPTAASATGFDHQRAIARLQRTLGDQRPHPVDSDANDAVRDRLMGEIRAIGLEPAVQDSVDCSAMPKSRAVSCSRIRNVVATLGSGDKPHLLLNSHYDSTPTGPGAADDGLGVATMLEIAAILKASPPPRPVTFLFNEGEEYGLNGAKSFVRSNPLAKRVDALINIEARGVGGPALMFETSDPNGAAIAAYAEGTRRPYANSLSTDFAKLIPNTTDAVFFKPAGWTLLNYSIIGNETRYHTPGDTITALDRDSLAHVGSEVLAATRTLAAMESPAQAGSGRAVFTDLAGRAFLRLPLVIAAVGLGLLLLGAAWLAWRRRAFGRPLAMAGAMVVAGTASSALAAIASTLVREGDYWRAYPLVPYAAIYATILAVMALIWAGWGGSLDRQRMRIAAWLLILILGGLASLAVPGASIFFLIAPTLGLLGGVLRGRAATVAAIAAIVVQFVMFAELLALVEMLLIDGPLWAVAPLAALAALPAIIEIDPSRLRPAFWFLALAALGLWAASMTMPRASAERPAAFTIDYFLDADRKSARWAVASKQAPLPQAMPGRWSKTVLPYNLRTRWASPAPVLDAPRATVRLISSEPDGAGRRIRFALSPGGGNAIAIRFAETAKIIGLGRPGQVEPIPAKGEPKKASLRCSGRSCEGFIVEARFADRSPVGVELFATRFALPAEARALVAARPSTAHPQYAPDSTIVLTRARL